LKKGECVAGTDHLLVMAMARLDEDRVIYLLEHCLRCGQTPGELLGLAREGVDRVGKLYAGGEYFLADLLMAAHIFERVLRVLFERVPITHDPGVPPIVFGTVEGDIHEIGKNLTIGFLRYSGFRVVDLGSSVAPQRFVEEVRRNQAQIVCLSGSLSTCYGSMRRTIAALGKAGLRHSTTVLIGGHVSEGIRTHVGADYFVDDCFAGVALCRQITGTLPAYLTVAGSS
jgi:methanogenic corrinoid protein MtbC1